MAATAPLPHILLTGGTGFFGRALLRHWHAKARSGCAVPQVTVLSRNPNAFAGRYPLLAQGSWLHWQQGDVCDASSLPCDRSFTHVLHAAADSTLGPRLTPLQRFDQIVNGTRNLLDAAVACGASRFLLISSGGVYGVQPANLEAFSEDSHTLPDPLNATNAYGVAKRTAEHLCALYNHTHSLVTVVARCFAFVGPDLPLDAHFAIGNFIRDALRAERITVQGDGRALRSYMDQQDLAFWLTELLVRGESGRAYNVGSDQAISIGELATLIRNLLAPDKQVQVLSGDVSSASRNRYVPNIDRAKSELGLQLTVPLPEAIRLTAASYQNL